jgi:polyribonucleotide nucleotidyltransferase
MIPKKYEYTVDVAGQDMTFSTGQIANQAGGAVTVRLGDTMVFAAVTMSSEPREGIDFFPLTVDYEERMYAGVAYSWFIFPPGRPPHGRSNPHRPPDRPPAPPLVFPRTCAMMFRSSCILFLQTG